MTIAKGNKVYLIKQNLKSWTVSCKVNEGLNVSYNLLISDYPTVDDVKAYILSCDIF